MPDFEESYLGQVRKLVGNKKIIVTGARAVVQDPEGRILLIRRRDNRKWAMPAGAQELDEDGHGVGDDEHPHKQVTVRRARGQVRRNIAGVDVRNRRHKCWTEQPPQPPLGPRR